MNTLKINLLIKKIRAEVIKEHLDKKGENRCVCFTCGNAAAALRDVGLTVIGVGENEELKPGKWFSYSDIQKVFNCFDATSGHLPIPLMASIAKRMRIYIGELIEDKYYIPTGSGESIVIMSMAYPDIDFFPIRFCNKETKYDTDAPLNNLVLALCGELGVER